MGLIVYGASLSPFVRKVRVVLAEKGLKYEHDPVSPFQPPPSFLEISPLKRIPVLRDTDLPEPNTLPDSSIISDYIDHKFPNPPLYPSDPFQRARALWFEEYADSVLAQACGAGLFFERVVKKFLRQQTDEAVVAATLKDKLPPLFDYLNREIGKRNFLVGDMFSIADIAVCTLLVNFEHAGEKIDSGRWPELARYVRDIHARPSFKACIDEESPIVKSVRAA
jgi:glutathione S-transferase